MLPPKMAEEVSGEKVVTSFIEDAPTHASISAWRKNMSTTDEGVLNLFFIVLYFICLARIVHLCKTDSPRWCNTITIK